MNKRIMIISDNNLNTVGGAQESTKIILESVNSKFDTFAIHPGKENPDIDNVIFFNLLNETRLKSIFKNPLKFIIYIFNIKNNINRSSPNIIHTQEQVGFFIVSLLLNLKLIKNNFRFIHTERGLYTKYSSFFINLFKLFFNKLDVLVLTTNLNYVLWAAIAKKRNSNLSLKIIENTAGPLFELQKTNFLKNIGQNFTIGFAGRQCDWKDWPLCIEIIEKIIRTTDGTLHVKMAVGCLDLKAINDTEKMFRHLSSILGDKFEGEINSSFPDMVRFYNDIDVFILSSKPGSESFGRTVVEAMSCNCVVLSTDEGGPKEIINNNNLIFINADDCVHKVTNLMSDTNELIKIKKCNLNIVAKKYSTINNIEKHLKMYGE
jgi:glycosyltransferase involved in cell wall biosynthesis